MLERLAEVIYWLGLGLGALLEIVGWAALALAPTDGKIFGVVAIVAGLIVCAIGRAILYVVAAR